MAALCSHLNFAAGQDALASNRTVSWPQVAPSLMRNGVLGLLARKGSKLTMGNTQ
jgi:hypothetical protein